MFNEEREFMESDKGKKQRKKISEDKHISEEDIFWLAKDGSDYEVIRYPAHRRVFKLICGEIVEQFPDKYKDEAEAAREFLKALFSGHLLPIARLVDEVFGEGSFEVLSMMSDQNDSAFMTSDYLRRARFRRKGK